MKKTTLPGQSVQLLLYISDFLVSHGIQYVAIGALAGAFLGNVRASLDADALIFLQEEPDKFLRTLKSWDGFKDLNLTFSPPDSSDPVRGVICVKDTFDNQVDLLLGIQGIERDVFNRAKEIEIFSQKLCVVCAEDFIAMKIFAGSPLDLDDAKNVIQVQRDSLDIALIERIISRYGETEQKHFKDLFESV